MSDLKCFLIGPNGAGKNTVGRMLANFLSLQFVDGDRELQKICGKDLSKFYELTNHERSKKIEDRIIKILHTKKNIIFTTTIPGIIDLCNHKLSNTKIQTIYLFTDPVNQYTRSMISNNIPSKLTKADNKLNYIIDLAKTMEPLYNSIADFVISTDNSSAEEVVNKVIDYLYCTVYG